MKSGTCNQGGLSAKLDDSNWSTVDLPHDFVVEGAFSPYDERFGDGHKEPYIPCNWSIKCIHTCRSSLKSDIA